jgi:hypothetical protein
MNIEQKRTPLGAGSNDAEQQGGSETNMNNTPIAANIQGHPSSVDAYIRHGWKLAVIPPGTKGPYYPGWNRTENTLSDASHLPPQHGIGLCHAYSGTMALDIDDWETATEALSKQEIDLQELYSAPDAVIIDSGRPGHGKLLYQMPFGLVLPSKKLISERPDGSRFNYVDFRCGTRTGFTVQDVLPPTLHPDTNQPYRWAGLGHWSRLPMIPPGLLAYWQSLIEEETYRNIHNETSLNSSWDEIIGALNHIPPDIDRDRWVAIGMAIHWAGCQTQKLDDAFHVWDTWSQGTLDNAASEPCSKYRGQQDLINSWRGFNPDGGRAIGTLFKIAKTYGWERPKPDAKEIFKHVTLKSADESFDSLAFLRPPAPSPDLSIWPKLLTQRAEEVSSSVGCDPLVPLMAGLAVVAGAVDARTRLQLADGFRVPPVLWLMTIGDPADKKSPGSRPMRHILQEIERDDRPRYQKAMLEWEGKEAHHEAARKDYLLFCSQADGMVGNEVAPIVPDLPPMPVQKKITVQDITSQKLVRHAADRPEGLLCWLDEMHSWIRKIVDRGSGEDRSAWVSAYESEYYEMDRVGGGSFHCDNLAVSLYGNVQPTVLTESIQNLTSDGLMQRFVPVCLRPEYTKVGDPIPDIFSNKSTWDSLVRIIHQAAPRTYTLSPGAYSRFREFQEWYLQTSKEDRILMVNESYRTATGKLVGLVGRLALIFHLIENAGAQDIEENLMVRTIQVVRNYIVPSLRYVYSDMGSADSLEYWVMNHILAVADRETVSLREIKHSARAQLPDHAKGWQRNQLILDAMISLENLKWVIRTLDDRSQGRVTWTINPELKTLFRKHRRNILKIRQARLDENRRIVIANGSYTKRRFVPGYIEEFGVEEAFFPEGS